MGRYSASTPTIRYDRRQYESQIGSGTAVRMRRRPATERRGVGRGAAWEEARRGKRRGAEAERGERRGREGV